MDSQMSALRRILGGILVTAAVAVVGSAASLSFASGSLGAATAATPRCTTAGLTVFQNLTAGTVASVTVGAIPAACGGATLQVTVNNGVANSSGSAAVPGGGGSVTVTIAVPPAVTAAEQTDLILVGP
jgi:hypothetical protein